MTNTYGDLMNIEKKILSGGNASFPTSAKNQLGHCSALGLES